MQIDGRCVGSGKPCFISAEVAQAHDGSLEKAHAYIEAVAEAGADAVKFQTHIAAEESTPSEPWRTRFSLRDATRYDYWKRMEFTESQWRELAAHAIERDLLFLSSPFSVAAVEMLERVGMPAWKIGAGEIVSRDLLNRVIMTGKPVMLSNGMSTWSELDYAVDLIRNGNVPFAVYQCTTAYPCPAELLGLNVLEQLRQRYECPVGFSDHTGSVYAGTAACALGANLIELHVTFSRSDSGPDVPASLTFEELASLVRGIRFIERAISHPVDKDGAALSLSDLRQIFRKKIVAKRTLPAGHCLTRDDLVLKKARDGQPADRINEWIGRVLRKQIAADEVIEGEDLE